MNLLVLKFRLIDNTADLIKVPICEISKKNIHILFFMHQVGNKKYSLLESNVNKKDDNQYPLSS